MGFMTLRLLVCLLMMATTVVASFPSQNHLVMPQYSDFEIGKPPRPNCLSWRLALETNNLRSMELVPIECMHYVGNYMQGGQYEKDCNFVTEEAHKYAEGLTPSEDGMDIWVFDMDETTVSNLPFYKYYGFGALPMNWTAIHDLLASGRAPAIPGSLRLYKKLLSLGFKIVFLTAAEISLTEDRARNLKKVGYKTWERLILNPDLGESSSAFKSRTRQELEEEGYRIRGNVGDQWADLLGNSTGDRTFKIPNPMYYVA